MSDREQHSERVALVTGATGAIGQAIAMNLAKRSGFSIVLVGRNAAVGREVADRIISEAQNDRVWFEFADLSRRESIAELAQRWRGPLHVLINNAAASPRRREETAEGIERQFATNVLGYFWMTRAFKPILIDSAPSRVVNVASYWAGDLQFDDLEFKKRRYDNNKSYRQSKQANRMLTAAFARKLADLGVTVNACHPGDVNSKLSNDLGFGGSQSAEQAADTPVWLATDPQVAGVTGRYYESRKARHDHFVDDVAAVEALFQVCKSYEAR